MKLSNKSYITNESADLHILRGASMNIKQVEAAINETHRIIDSIHSFDIDISEILGMRNLSAFVGEIFAASLNKSCDDLFKKNPHQDGYPDLLLMDREGMVNWGNLSNRIDEKDPFSPFPSGGVEVKATCGSVPTPAQCRKKGIKKPQIGDTRIDLLRGYDWKAHHQETNNLFGIVWDFIDEKPCIVGLFYSANLDTSYGSENNHWGQIVQPKEGGGRTTSVSIMKRDGVYQMYKGWVAVIDNDKYIDFFNKYNKASLIKRLS